MDSAYVSKAFTRVDSSFSCPGIAEQHSSSSISFYLFSCILHCLCHYFFYRSICSVDVDFRCSASWDAYGLPLLPCFFVLNNAVQHLDQLQDVFLVCDLYVVGNSTFVAQQEAVYTLNCSSSSMGMGLG